MDQETDSKEIKVACVMITVLVILSFSEYASYSFGLSQQQIINLPIDIACVDNSMPLSHDPFYFNSQAFPEPVRQPARTDIRDTTLLDITDYCDSIVSGGSIQSAIDKALPGSTICVKSGTYKGKLNINKNNITLKNYNGQNPLIIPGMSIGNRVEINASGTTVEGFEIEGGYEGVKIYKPNTTIRNNYIHDNKYAGVLIVSTDNNFIIGNEIDSNGTCSSSCVQPNEVKLSPKNVHGIYISDYLCHGAKNNVIRNNIIKDHPGMGINFNGSLCNTWIDGTIIEDNELINNAWGIAMFYNVKNSRVSNNRLSVSTYPTTNHSEFTHIGLWGSKNNLFHHNTIISTKSNYKPILIFDTTSEHQDFDYNTWITSNNTWMWGGETIYFFKQSYRLVTGWDRHGSIK